LEKGVAELRGRVEELSRRIDDLASSLNRRIDDLRNDVSHWLGELSKRMDGLEGRIGRLEERIDRYFRWTISLLIIVLTSILATLIPLMLKILGVI